MQQLQPYPFLMSKIRKRALNLGTQILANPFLYNYQMKSIHLLLLVGLITLSQTLTTTVNGATYTVYKCQSFKINVGRTYIDAGSVEVCNNDSALFINVQLANGYTFVGEQSVKIDFGVGLDISQRPVAGKFPVKSEKSNILVGQTYWGGVVSLKVPQVTCDSLITMFAHVDVSQDGVNGETGFAGATCPTTDKPWFCYITYQATCIPPVPNSDTSCEVDPWQDKCLKCQTAYGYGPKNFLQQFGSKRWGWITTLSAGETYSNTIYGGAGLNDISKATVVGAISYAYTTDHYVYVSVTIRSSCLVRAYHVYIGGQIPQNFVANGKFPYRGGDLPSGTAFVIPQGGVDLEGASQAYIIAHFDVCCKIN